MDDLTAQVSQQATLMLGTIHDAALRSVISCLEYQFDTGEFLSMTIFCSISVTIMRCNDELSLTMS